MESNELKRDQVYNCPTLLYYLSPHACDFFYVSSCTERDTIKSLDTGWRDDIRIIVVIIT